MTTAITRRHVIGAAAATGLTLSGLPSARAADAIKIGYWPIASGLPLYVGLEKGFFKEAGLNVEGAKFASAQQVAEAMVAGRIQGSANGTASAALALAEITSPGLFKIICSNPSNHNLVLDEFVVAKDSPIKSIAELKGKKVASGPGIQNVTLAKIMLEKNGIANPVVTELPVGQHVPALAAGQIDAVYTLEPTGTTGRLKGLTKVLETGVISKYVLGDAEAPWFGGSAAVTTQFLRRAPRRREEIHRRLCQGGRVRSQEPGRITQPPRRLHCHRPDVGEGSAALRLHALQRVQGERCRLLPEVLRCLHRAKIFTRKVEVKPLLYTA